MSEEELRREAVRRRLAGESPDQIASALGRTDRWVRKWVARHQRNITPNPEQLARVLVRRLKRELREELPPNPDGTPRFAERRVESMPVDYPPDERRAHELLERYADLRRGHHAKGAKRSAADFVTLLLKKRLLSSPAAFANTLTQHRLHRRAARRRRRASQRRPAPGRMGPQ